MRAGVFQFDYACLVRTSPSTILRHRPPVTPASERSPDLNRYSPDDHQIFTRSHGAALPPFLQLSALAETPFVAPRFVRMLGKGITRSDDEVPYETAGCQRGLASAAGLASSEAAGRASSCRQPRNATGRPEVLVEHPSDPETGAGAPLATSLVTKLSGDEQRILFSQLCNVLDPGVAVALSSVSKELRAATLALLQQLKAGHEAASALCRKLDSKNILAKIRHRNCKELREATSVNCCFRGLSADDLGSLGTLGSLLPAVEKLRLDNPAAGPDGVRRLMAELGAGALPALTLLSVFNTHVGDAGASALATALGQGAMPRLRMLGLINAAIGHAGMVALAPALRRLPALEVLQISHNPLGDEGLAALVALPPPAGAPPLTTGELATLRTIDLSRTQITDAGCAALAAALERGALPVLETLYCEDILASDAGLVYKALDKRAQN